MRNNRVARSVVINKEVLVLYKTDDSYYVGRDRYTHGDYAYTRFRREENEKLEKERYLQDLF